MLNAWSEAGKLTGNEFIAKTIVTSDILNKMAAHYGVKAYNTLTGFKYIAGVIREKEGKEQFIVGGEESYGYLIGDFVRDKDALCSAVMIAEMAAYAKDKGLTLFDLLVDIYGKFGFYKEGLISLTKKGKDGVAEIAAMMENLRNNPPAEIAGSKTMTMLDYHLQEETDLFSGNKCPLHFEKSNVLQFILEDGSKISARPSGTEPKIKFYFSIVEPLTNPDNFEETEAVLDAKLQQIISELHLN
jgi:phosphoglucomutase